MFGLDFSISKRSIVDMSQILEKNNVNFFLISHGRLTIWREPDMREDEYSMSDILSDKRMANVLMSNNQFQLRNFVDTMMTIVNEIDEVDTKE